MSFHPKLLEAGSFLERNKGAASGLFAAAALGLLLTACGKRDADISPGPIVEVTGSLINWTRAAIFSVLAGGLGGVWQWWQSKDSLNRVKATKAEDGTVLIKGGRTGASKHDIGVNAVEGAAFGFFGSLTIDGISLFTENWQLALLIFAPSAALGFGVLAINTEK